MNRWTNAGGSIDGHLPSAWRVPYKRVYPRLEARDAINTSISMHEEGRMPQTAALSMSASACEEWVNWMNISAAWLWYVSFECERRTYRRALSWMLLRMNWYMESPGGHCRASAVCDQEQSKRSFPYGIPLGALRREADVDLALLRWYTMWDQEPAPSGHRCRSMCCFERVRFFRVLWDRLSGGWA